MALINCTECGNQISDKAISCPKCGAPIANSPQNEINTPPIQEKMSDLNPHKGTETNYFSNASGIKITNIRFIVGSNTYPMQGITGINTHYVSPSRTAPILLIVFGALALLFIQNIPVFGLIGIGFIIWGIVSLIRKKNTYVLQITTAAGITSAVTSEDEDYIAGIARALNDAIIHRG